MPMLPLMHEMAWDLPQEDTQLLAVDFSTMFFEGYSHAPGYRDMRRGSAGGKTACVSQGLREASQVLFKMLDPWDFARGVDREPFLS